MSSATPVSASAYADRAWEHLLASQPWDAARVCRDGLALYPTSADLWYVLGESLHDVSSPDAAAAYREAVRLSPRSACAWQALGKRLLNGFGPTVDEAIEALRTSIRLKGSDPWTHAYLAVALWHKGDLPGAEAEYHLALQHGGDEPLFAKWHAEFVNATKPRTHEAPQPRGD
jgi:cytochrome c-type biogenesis protein CcmH/NrfG